MTNLIKRIFSLFGIACVSLVCYSQEPTDVNIQLATLEESYSEKPDKFGDTISMEELSSSYSYNSYSVPQYDNNSSSYSHNHLSDSQLMKYYVIEDAKKIKKRGRIGGLIVGLAGVATFAGILIYDKAIRADDPTARAVGVCIMGGCIAGGLTWWAVANYKGNKMINSVRNIALLEHDIVSIGSNKLSTSLDYVNSRGYVKTDGVGISLHYTF